MVKFDKEKLEIRIGFKYDHHALYVLNHLNKLTLLLDCQKYIKASQSFQNIINSQEDHLRALLSLPSTRKEYSRSRSPKPHHHHHLRHSRERQDDDTPAKHHHEHRYHRDERHHERSESIKRKGIVMVDKRRSASKGKDPKTSSIKEVHLQNTRQPQVVPQICNQ